MSFYFHDIYTLLLVFAGICFCIIHFFDQKRLFLLLEYFLNQKYAVTYHRKDSLLFTVFTFFNVWIIFSIIISFYYAHAQETMSIFMFFQIAIILALFFSIKSIIVYFAGFLFDLTHYANKYIAGYCTSLFLVSFIILPIIILISYSANGALVKDYSIYVSYLAVIIYFLLKIILLKRLNVFSIKSLFYNILYLCVLELVPYLALYQLFNLLTTH